MFFDNCDHHPTHLGTISQAQGLMAQILQGMWRGQLHTALVQLALLATMMTGKVRAAFGAYMLQSNTCLGAESDMLLCVLSPAHLRIRESDQNMAGLPGEGVLWGGW